MNTKLLYQVFFLTWFGCTTLGLSAQQPSNASRPPPALGLLRLKSQAKPTEAATLSTAKFSVDDLATAGVAGASKGRKNSADYVALESNKQWSQRLRGSARNPAYASFQVYGSQTTIIEVGGARLGLTASPVAGSLQLMFDDSTTGIVQWKTLNYHIPLDRFDGRNFAPLPVLTVHLDPTAGVWHLYAGTRLFADHLPLIAAIKDSRQLTVTAGNEGAWICGLVLSDENPLYEDANFNGIDDAFEKQARGAPLAADSPVALRQQMAQQWKDYQRTRPPPALFLNRPLPDRISKASPKQ